MEACWAHNPEVRGSKPRSARIFFTHILFFSLARFLFLLKLFQHFFLLQNRVNLYIPIILAVFYKKKKKYSKPSQTLVYTGKYVFRVQVEKPQNISTERKASFTSVTLSPQLTAMWSGFSLLSDIVNAKID